MARAVPGLWPAMRALRVVWVQGTSVALDWWYGTPSTVRSGSQVPQFEGDNGYEPTKYPAIWRALRHLQLSADDVFVDVGCGMGRVVCMAARHPVKKCIGIEVRQDLALIAKCNACTLRGRRTPIEIWHTDARTADYAGATALFMYNPFTEQIMRRVMARISQSLIAAPRRIRIVYVAPRQAHVLDECSWLRRTGVVEVPYHVGVKTRAVYWESAE